MDNQYRKSGKLSLRNSIMVWIGGAVLGWALMVVSIYNVLRFPAEQIADNGLVPPPAAVATDEQMLNEIAPAAGETSTMTEEIGGAADMKDAVMKDAVMKDNGEKDGEDDEEKDKDEEKKDEPPQ